jgi:hypothetical protein
MFSSGWSWIAAQVRLLILKWYRQPDRSPIQLRIQGSCTPLSLAADKNILCTLDGRRILVFFCAIQGMVSIALLFLFALSYPLPAGELGDGDTDVGKP